MTEEKDDALKLDSDHSALSIFLMTQLLLLTLAASYVLKKYKVRVIHETLIGLVLGMLVGLLGFGRLNVGFDNQYFFNLLLPPIILYSGFDMDVESLSTYFWRILLFAFVGTFLSAFIVGWVIYILVIGGTLQLTVIECYMVGSILSSTDPITVLAVMKNLNLDKSLYSIIFFESTLNDAVSIVLYQTLDSFRGHPITSGSLWKALTYFISSFASSFLLGVAVALLCAFLIGRILRGIGQQKYGGLEACIVALVAYSSYFLSNLLGLSGIVSLLFCGMTMKHYVQPSLSVKTNQTLMSLFQLTAQLSETFIFIYLGITLFANSYAKTGNNKEDDEDALVLVWKPVEIVVVFFGVLLGRCIVFPLAWFVNFIKLCRSNGIRYASMSGIKWLRELYRRLQRARENYRNGSSWSILPERISLNNSSILQTEPAETPDNVPIPIAHQLLLWFSGLRGAIAFALSMDMKPSSVPLPPSNSTQPVMRTPVEEIRTTTLAVCVLSILLLGGSIGFVVRWLEAYTQNRRSSNAQYMERQTNGTSMKWLRWFDEHIMKPIFVGRPTKYQRQQGYDSTEEYELNQDQGALLQSAYPGEDNSSHDVPMSKTLGLFDQQEKKNSGEDLYVETPPVDTSLRGRRSQSTEELPPTGHEWGDFEEAE